MFCDALSVPIPADQDRRSVAACSLGADPTEAEARFPNAAGALRSDRPRRVGLNTAKDPTIRRDR